MPTEAIQAPKTRMPRNSQLSITVPQDVWLPTAVCSYGYFLLAPNRWDPATATLERTFDAAEFGLPQSRVTIRIDQPGGKGEPLRARCDRSAPTSLQASLRRAVGRMLRLEMDLRPWRRRHPTAVRRGFGRLFRSPTLFEDMVKTITSCNVGWPSTVRMNQRLVDRVGQGAFPTPEQLARWTPKRLQTACGVGYRAKRVVGLARRFVSGDLDPGWFESPDRDDEELRNTILQIDGFGPYATANVLQLLGHNDHLPIDTETYRLHCKRLGIERPESDRTLDQAILEHYEPYRPHRFLAYWFDLWRDYESQRGIASTWDRETVGASFTASKLK